MIFSRRLRVLRRRRAGRPALNSLEWVHWQIHANILPKSLTSPLAFLILHWPATSGGRNHPGLPSGGGRGVAIHLNQGGAR